MLKTVVLAIAFAAWGLSASAHSQGHGTLDENAIRIAATKVAAFLVNNDVGKEWGLLTQSWGLIPVEQTKILAKVDSYFVVAVENLEENETLYILIEDSGEVLDVNFTGTFPYVYDVQEPGTTSSD